MRLIEFIVIVAAALVVSGPAWAGDLDRDAVADSRDNCAQASNPDQLDSDGDGLGNACDFDYNNDGRVDAADAKLLQAAIGTDEGDEGFADAFDADSDGLIAGTDWAAFLNATRKN